MEIVKTRESTKQTKISKQTKARFFFRLFRYFRLFRTLVFFFFTLDTRGNSAKYRATPYAAAFLAIFFCNAFIATAQNAPPPVSKTITGRILGEDGQPLSAVPVFLVPIARGALPGRIGSGPNQALTDEEGNFAFDNVASGSYGISASVPGFITLPPDEESGTGIYHPGDTVHLTMVKGGVITGKVTNARGEPLTGVPVSAIRVGGIEGEEDGFTLPTGFGRNWRTDDLGVYRIYGLVPGSYVVQAGRRNPGGPNFPTQYGEDAPTFYPSAPRATAVPVVIRQGQEIIGIDVRLRGEKGRSLSGKVIAKSSTNTNRFTGVQISLYAADSDAVVATTFQRNARGDTSFAFSGIADGEYDIVARQNNPLSSESDSASAPHRVSIRGADVAGIELPLLPLGTIKGRVVIEPTPNPSCPNPTQAAVQEVLLQAELEETSQRKSPLSPRRPSAPNKNGEFTIRNLEPGRYRLGQIFPHENWYVREMQIDAPAAATARKTAAAAPVNVARNGIAIKSGDKIGGLRVSVADGAAAIKGKVSKEKSTVFLLPVEKEAAEDLLRYRQDAAGSSGGFLFQHLAPGRYYLLAKSGTVDRNRLWNATSRNALRAEAVAAGITIELQPCQRIPDFSLSVK
jgi:hypothetical protein